MTTTWFIGLAVKATLLLLSAVLIAGAARRSPAATRHFVWLAALGALLVLPVMAVVGPAWSPGWAATWLPDYLLLDTLDVIAATEPGGIPQGSPDAEANGAQASAGAETSDRAVRSLTLVLSQQASGERSAADLAPAGRLAPLSAGSSATDVAGTAAPIVTGAGLSPWLILLWVVGALTMLMRLGVGFARRARIARDATPVEAGSIVSASEEAARDLGLGRGARILLGDSHLVPMTWGVLRPVLFLPSAARNWPGRRLRTVLLHELAHIKRRDSLSRTLAQLSCGVFWFHPLAWLSAWRMLREQERACDDVVILAGEDPHHYAETLVAIAREFRGPRPSVVGALAFSRRSNLEHRVLSILDPLERRRKLSPIRKALLSVVFIGMAAPLAALHPTATAQEPDKQASATNKSKPQGIVVKRPDAKVEGVSVVVPGPVGKSAPGSDVAPQADAPAPQAVRVSPPTGRAAPQADAAAPRVAVAVRQADALPPGVGVVAPRADTLPPGVVAPRADTLPPGVDVVAPRADALPPGVGEAVPQADARPPVVGVVAPRAGASGIGTVVPRATSGVAGTGVIAPRADAGVPGIGVAPRPTGATGTGVVAPRADGGSSGIGVVAPAAEQEARAVEQRRRVRRVDSSSRIEVRAEQVVRIASSVDDVELEDGGSLVISEGNRRLEIRRTSSGERQQSYSVDGSEAAFDDDAREWADGILEHVARIGTMRGNIQITTSRGEIGEIADLRLELEPLELALEELQLQMEPLELAIQGIEPLELAIEGIELEPLELAIEPLEAIELAIEPLDIRVELAEVAELTELNAERVQIAIEGMQKEMVELQLELERAMEPLEIAIEPLEIAIEPLELAIHDLEYAIEPLELALDLPLISDLRLQRFDHISTWTEGGSRFVALRSGGVKLGETVDGIEVGEEGDLIIDERTADDLHRRLHVFANENGETVFEWLVDGDQVPFDAAGREWLQPILDWLNDNRWDEAALLF